MKVGILDGVSVMFNQYTLAFALVPVFAYVVTGFVSNETNHLSIIRNKSRAEIWRKNSIHTAVFSLLFTMVTVFISVGMSAYFMSGFQNTWTEEGGKIHKILMHYIKAEDLRVGSAKVLEKLSMYNVWNVMLLVIIFTTLGLMVVSLLIYIIYIYTNSFIYGYIILILLMMIDTFSEKVSFLFRQVVIESGEWLNISALMWNLVYLCVLLIVLYLCGKHVFCKKDLL